MQQHKRQCPFTNCPCDKCELIETRRRLDQHMKKRRAAAASPEPSKQPRVETPEPPKEAPVQVEAAFGHRRPLFAPASPEEKPAGGFQTLCIPVFVPVPAVSAAAPVDASRLSTTELLQRAAAQHLAAHAPALPPPAAPPTFLLAANPPPALFSVPSSASSSPPALIGVHEQPPPMLVDPVMAQLLQSTPTLDFSSCASGISNFRQLEQFLTLRTSQHTM